MTEESFMEVDLVDSDGVIQSTAAVSSALWASSYEKLADIAARSGDGVEVRSQRDRVRRVASGRGSDSLTVVPDEFDKSERPTQPDVPQICPECKGEGSVLTDVSEDANPRMVRRLCATCWGRRRATAEEVSAYKARTGVE
jgi:DnaJ-class molecular chaperone